MDKQKIQDIAESVEQYVKEHIIDKYLGKVTCHDSLRDLTHHLTQLENRSREFHNPSFVVLVVGPVKSGKSTFVNLVARNYVSPTHFLECTVRPSLISSGNEERLAVYRSLNSVRKEEQMNSILDSINGLTDEDALIDVKKETYEFTEKNVDRYIKLDSIAVVEDDILLTSIRTKGGKLLQDNVYLVDMAGFDGANVNFDTPSYKAIIERADLIVFVQSSNSAISKVSKSFFELLHAKNRSVPVCLVHNVFESAYWREDEKKRKDIEVQKDYAILQIVKTYDLVLDKANAFNLNLGKVCDLRQGNYKREAEPNLREETLQFEEAEQKMFELFGKRGTIRMVNCITRTKTQRDILLKKIKESMMKHCEMFGKYEKMKASFDSLKKKKDSLSIILDTSIRIEELTVIVETEYGSIKKSLEPRGNNGKFKTSEARIIVRKLLAGIKDEVTLLLNRRRKEITNVKNSDEIQLWLTSILNNTAQYIKEQIVSIDCRVDDVDVEWNSDIDVDQLIPCKPWAYKHNMEEMKRYLSFVVESLNGFKSGADVIVKGHIEKTLYPQLLTELIETKEYVVNKLVSDVNAEIEHLKGLALQTVIPDIEEFRQEQLIIEGLKKETEGLNIRTDE